MLKTILSFKHFLRAPVITQLRSKFTPDNSNVPTIKEEDLTEDFVRGSGPGGQSVSKTSNCVLLKHIPTGVVIRCHDTRSLEQNRKIARVRLITRLDHLLNGENSVEAQIKRENKRLKEIKDSMKKERLKKKLKLKEQLKDEELNVEKHPKD